MAAGRKVLNMLMWDEWNVEATLLLKAQYVFKATICAPYTWTTMFQMQAVNIMHVKQ
jgi:hypothetical protein